MIAMADWRASVEAAAAEGLDAEIEGNPELVGRPVVVAVVMAQCTPGLRHRISLIRPPGRCKARMAP